MTSCGIGRGWAWSYMFLPARGSYIKNMALRARGPEFTLEVISLCCLSFLTCLLSQHLPHGGYC